MAVFSTNQVRQFYVAKGYNSSVNASSDEGTIGAVKTVNIGPDKEIYFLYKGADTVLKSDRMQVKNINYIKKVTPAEMRIPLKKLEVTIAAEALSDSKPIVGQDYVLRINFRQFYGMSDQDQYIKDAAVHVTSGMTASIFYKKMVEALSLAFSREVGATKDTNPYLEFCVYDSTSTSEKNAAAVIADLKKASGSQTITATKIIIKEKIQEHTVGLQAQERVFFDVMPTTICINNADVVSGSSVTVVYENRKDVIWGTVTDATPAKYVEDSNSESPTYQQLIPNASLVAGTNAIGNGATIADMEYFYMGERGDQYRMAGWPNYIPTKYMVNPASEYYVLEIHYGFTDTGVSSYRSEKDITVVSTTADYINNLYNAIMNAAGFNDLANLTTRVATLEEAAEDGSGTT